MTEKEALKILAQQEKRFEDAGFGRGKVLAKSAREQYDAMLDWRRKSEAVAAEYGAAKKRLDAFTAELKRKEEQSRKLLDDVARIRKVCVPLRKTVRNGDILKTRERQAQRRFVEKVDLLQKMDIS